MMLPLRRVQLAAKTRGEARSGEKYVRRKLEDNIGTGKWRFRDVKFFQSEDDICRDKG